MEHQQQHRQEAVRQRFELPGSTSPAIGRGARGDRTGAAGRQDHRDDRRSGRPSTTTAIPKRFIEIQGHESRDHHRLDAVLAVHPCSDASRRATDDEIGGNTIIVLTYSGFYDTDLAYAIRATVTNTLASL